MGESRRVSGGFSSESKGSGGPLHLPFGRFLGEEAVENLRRLHSDGKKIRPAQRPKTVGQQFFLLKVSGRQDNDLLVGPRDLSRIIGRGISVNSTYGQLPGRESLFEISSKQIKEITIVAIESGISDMLAFKIDGDSRRYICTLRL